MELVIIYGPPAAGKLTVATELAELTGFKLFHNHLTVNAARSVFEMGTVEMSRVLTRMRIEMFKEAAAAGVSLINTFANMRLRDAPRPTLLDDYMDEVDRVVSERGGTVRRVQLRPPVEVLLERVDTASRRTHQKIGERAALQRFVDEREIYDLIDPSDLSIDNSDRSPTDVAAEICDRFGL